MKSLSRRGDMFAEVTDVPVWTDLIGSVSEGTGSASLTYETYRDTAFKMYFMRHDQADELNYIYQMPHEWSPGTKVRPHLHVIPMGDPVSAQVVALTILYTWSRVGYALPANSGWSTSTITKTINPGDVYKETILSMGDVTPPAGAKESDLLLVQYKRDLVPDTYQTSKTGGTATANLAILSVDVHYQKVKLGTATEMPRP